MEIELLKYRSASQVFRLVGLGPDGSNIIAKRYPEPNALAEYRIYERVLRHLPLVPLRHYGLIKEEATAFCWAFMEDAAGVSYSPGVRDHTVEAAAWLAVLHTSALDVARELALPDRSPHHYFDSLRLGRDRIRRSLTSKLLSGDNRVVLAALAAQCDAVEAKWEFIEGLCSGVSQTFVHADLHVANVRVRTTSGGSSLVPFDWESAGWGVPALDLALTGVDLATYCSIAGQVWSRLDIQTARALAVVGRLFHLCAFIEWESRSLGSEWLHRPMKHMAYYHADMSEAIEAIELLLERRLPHRWETSGATI